jgi:limonene-1,2-epoxide hydrolase
MSNIGLVQEFIDCWNARDYDGLMTRFTEDVCYHNVPMQPLNGTDEVAGFLQGFVGMAESIDWVVHFIAEDASGNVLTERTDNFTIAGQTLSLPVMGTFEFRDGKISHWRDYFDLKDFETQMAGITGG